MEVLAPQHPQPRLLGGRYNQTPLAATTSPGAPCFALVDTAQMKNNVVAPAPLTVSASSEEAAGRCTGVARVKIPTDLVDIRAYVRWEDAGKPERHASRVATRQVRDGSSGSADRGALGRLPQRHSPQVQPDPRPRRPTRARSTAGTSRRRFARPRRCATIASLRPPVSAPDVPAAPEEWFEPEPEVVRKYLRRIAATREAASPSFAATTAKPSRPRSPRRSWTDGRARLLAERPVASDQQADVSRR